MWDRGAGMRSSPMDVRPDEDKDILANLSVYRYSSVSIGGQSYGEDMSPAEMHLKFYHFLFSREGEEGFRVFAKRLQDINVGERKRLRQQVLRQPGPGQFQSRFDLQPTGASAWGAGSFASAMGGQQQFPPVPMAATTAPSYPGPGFPPAFPPQGPAFAATGPGYQQAGLGVQPQHFGAEGQFRQQLGGAPLGGGTLQGQPWAAAGGPSQPPGFAGGFGHPPQAAWPGTHPAPFAPAGQLQPVAFGTAAMAPPTFPAPTATQGSHFQPEWNTAGTPTGNAAADRDRAAWDAMQFSDHIPLGLPPPHLR